MFNALEWSIAARYLRARRRDGFISIIAWFSLIGIALGVATLIIVMSVMNGFRIELLNRVLGLNGHLVAQSSSGNMSDYGRIADEILAIPGVIDAAPLIEGQVMATSRGQARGAMVRGIRAADLRRRNIVAGNIQSGSLEAFKGRNAVVVGKRLADKFGLLPGDNITLVTPQTRVTAFGSVPRMKTYRIAATFLAGMYEYDASFIYMPLDAAQVFFRIGDSVNGIETFIKNPDETRSFRMALGRIVGVERITDWQQLNRHFFLALQTERNVMFIILTLIILVAAFNIISSLIMLVNDKAKAIAIFMRSGYL